MKIRIAATLTTLIVAGAAFGLDNVLWSPNPHTPPRTPWQLPFFILLESIESLWFGLCVAFIILGCRRCAVSQAMRQSPPGRCT